MSSSHVAFSDSSTTERSKKDRALVLDGILPSWVAAERKDVEADYRIGCPVRSCPSRHKQMTPEVWIARFLQIYEIKKYVFYSSILM